MESELLNKVRDRETNYATILIKENNKRISYFESDGIMTYIVLDDGSRVKVEMFLHQLENVLPSTIFYRCGWSFIVNLSNIQEYWMLEYPFLVMNNGEVIPVPQSDKDVVKNLVSSRLAVMEG